MKNFTLYMIFLAAIIIVTVPDELNCMPQTVVAASEHINALPDLSQVMPPILTDCALTDMKFVCDLQPGSKDNRGKWINGTETMRLLQHQGKLFASTGVWMDQPYHQAKGEQPWTGPQILVKESANSPWRVDMSFPKATRIESMISAVFKTDGSGHKLHTPAAILMASPSSMNTESTWTRDDLTGKWESNLTPEEMKRGVRSLCTHLDPKTGIHYLFGGSALGCISRAVYDPEAPGKIRWLETELKGTGRVMGMAEANGVLYAACGIKSEESLSGGLFKRVDGDKPHWELLWRWPYLIRKDETEILRGLTAVQDPKDSDHQVLIGTCSYLGQIYRIDPDSDHIVTTEMDIRTYFSEVLKAPQIKKEKGALLSAYNNFLHVTDPDNGKQFYLLGLWFTGRVMAGNSAWYLVRDANGAYGYGHVFDPGQPKPNPPRGLLAVRTIEVSPFPEDKGRVFYFGGYDCADIQSHNTAWIYKGTLQFSSGEKTKRKN